MGIYIQKENRQIGPIDAETVRAGIKSGEYSGEELAWTQGNAAWHPLRELLPPAQDLPNAKLDGSLSERKPDRFGWLVVLLCPLMVGVLISIYFSTIEPLFPPTTSRVRREYKETYPGTFYLMTDTEVVVTPIEKQNEKRSFSVVTRWRGVTSSEKEVVTYSRFANRHWHVESRIKKPVSETHFSQDDVLRPIEDMLSRGNPFDKRRATPSGINSLLGSTPKPMSPRLDLPALE
jgi:hypothetical protein